MKRAATLVLGWLLAATAHGALRGTGDLGVVVERASGQLLVVELSDDTRPRMATGYVDAMHGVCIACHTKVAAELNRPHHAQCATCHLQGPIPVWRRP